MDSKYVVKLCRRDGLLFQVSILDAQAAAQRSFAVPPRMSLAKLCQRSADDDSTKRLAAPFALCFHI